MKIFSEIVKDYSSTIGDRNEVDDIMALLLFTQTILGQNVLNPKWSWRGIVFRHIFIAVLIVYVLFGTADVLKIKTDVTSKCEASYTFIITGTFVVKYTIYLITRENFRKVYSLAKMTLFDIIKKTSADKSIYIVNTMKMTVKMFFLIIFIPIFMYMLIAIWYNMHGERVTLSKTTSILMPMTSPYYEIGFIAHAIYLFCMAFTICVIDVWFVVVMFFFCVTCDCLEELLKVEPKLDDESDLEYAIRLNNTLRIYYTRHAKLMEYLNILSDMYKWAAVVPLINVLLACCLLMFLMSEISGFRMTQVQLTFMANCVPPFAELFAYNWFGEQVKLKTTNLDRALLNFDWMSMRLADKKNYLILITYMQKEFAIKTVLGKDLSLSTMADVLKGSYQAFTLLKTMED